MEISIKDYLKLSLLFIRVINIVFILQNRCKISSLNNVRFLFWFSPLKFTEVLLMFLWLCKNRHFFVGCKKQGLSICINMNGHFNSVVSFFVFFIYFLNLSYHPLIITLREGLTLSGYLWNLGLSYNQRLCSPVR